jgi:hypothetical protein
VGREAAGESGARFLTRLLAIAWQDQNDPEALADLDDSELEGILFSLAGVCGQLNDVTDRLGAGVDPVRLGGR